MERGTRGFRLEDEGVSFLSHSIVLESSIASGVIVSEKKVSMDYLLAGVGLRIDVLSKKMTQNVTSH